MALFTQFMPLKAVKTILLHASGADYQLVLHIQYMFEIALHHYRKNTASLIIATCPIPYRISVVLWFSIVPPSCYPCSSFRSPIT